MNIKKKFFDYNIKQWSKQYLIINKKGNINICIKHNKKNIYIDLNKLINQKSLKKNILPIKLSFPQIIKQKINKIYLNFKKYIKKYKYNGKYLFIYPIKVNQQSYLIRSILKNIKNKIGLEAGSKSELMTILINSNKNVTIICNGYKDKKYIYLALLASKIGHKIFFVIEKIKEIKLILNVKIKNNFFIGIRSKLNSLELNKKINKNQIKFGLTSLQILKTIKILKKNNLLKKLKLLHCHIKSQINDINYIKIYLKEIINIYIDLIKIFKIKIKYLDLGGGLAVNYAEKNKMNYNIKTYASKIIKLIQYICKKNKTKTPNIITESGRFITAHHEILITNIVNTEKNNFYKIKPLKKNIITNKKNILIIKIWIIWNKIKKLTKKIKKNKEKYIFKLLNKIKINFKLGIYNLKIKSYIEKIYNNILKYIYKKKLIKNKKKLKYINLYTSDKIHINISLFQSLPDMWGAKQKFPILPIEGLNKPIKRYTNISDITCDSDGTIYQYINKKNINNTLPIQNFKSNKPPKIGIFMIGAYQKTLGNIHNLFGNIKTLIIYTRKNNKFKEISINKNDNISNMLRYTNTNKKKILLFLKRNKIHINKLNKYLKYKTYLE